jgi:hypothetical protein
MTPEGEETSKVNKVISSLSRKARAGLAQGSRRARARLDKIILKIFCILPPWLRNGASVFFPLECLPPWLLCVFPLMTFFLFFGHVDFCAIRIFLASLRANGLTDAVTVTANRILLDFYENRTPANRVEPLRAVLDLIPYDLQLSLIRALLTSHEELPEVEAEQLLLKRKRAERDRERKRLALEVPPFFTPFMSAKCPV